MEEALYLNDSYLKEAEAAVISVKDDKFVVLDKTCFYPNSGGQPFDTGRFVRLSDGKEFPVVFVGKFGENISHEVSVPGLKEGDKLRCHLDWDRRYILMRYHTAAHIISAVFSKEAGALITGNQLGTEKSRIDFNLENFDRDKIGEYFAKSNSLIEKDLPVSISYMPRDQAEENPSLFKLAKALPSEIKELRIMAIGDYDKQADGGTHVKSLKEVGRITFLKAENKGKANRRVYFKVE